MEVVHLPANADNYMYLIIDKSTKDCVVVDPCDHARITDYVKSRSLNLTKILTTHHHLDHAGGNAELLKSFDGSNLPVLGGSDKVQSLSQKVAHGDSFKIGNSVNVSCLSTPCHTQDHICYFVKDDVDGRQCVFTGDTLFLGGCGRFFEGNPEQMFNALVTILGKLPSKTEVYCGHEYTEKNLKFAMTVDPNNNDLKERLQHVSELRSKNEPTIPASIDIELKTNPFMRVNDPSIQKFLETVGDPIATMKKLRELKDKY